MDNSLESKPFLRNTKQTPSPPWDILFDSADDLNRREEYRGLIGIYLQKTPLKNSDEEALLSRLIILTEPD